MNAKKVRELRREMRAEGLYSEAPNYKQKLTRKVVYIQDHLGNIEARPVEKVTLINLSKYRYRRIKKGLE